jgi:hypothetical protein
MVFFMMNASELVAKLNGKSAEEQAKIIANYVSAKKKKQTIDEERKEVRDKCFKDAKTLTKITREKQLKLTEQVFEFVSARLRNRLLESFSSD